MDDEVKARVERWMEDAIIGLKLCPFASPVWRKGQVKIVESRATNAEGVLRRACGEAARLLGADPEDVATTLVVATRALGDFEEFLDVAAALEDILAEAGTEGVLQVATFHPDYRFEDAEPDELSNFTNRAPYPTLHLLREEQISQAVDAHPDPEGIPERNIERLEAMGRGEVELLWSRWMPVRKP